MNSSPSAAAHLHTSAHHRPIFRGTTFGHWSRPHPGIHRHGGGLLLQQQQSAAAVPVPVTSGQSPTKILHVSLRLQRQRRAPPAAISSRKILGIKGTKFTKPWERLLAEPCICKGKRMTAGAWCGEDPFCCCSPDWQAFACDFQLTSYQSLFSSLHYLVRTISHDQLKCLT